MRSLQKIVEILKRIIQYISRTVIDSINFLFFEIRLKKFTARLFVLIAVSTWSWHLFRALIRPVPSTYEFWLYYLYSLCLFYSILKLADYILSKVKALYLEHHVNPNRDEFEKLYHDWKFLKAYIQNFPWIPKSTPVDVVVSILVFLGVLYGVFKVKQASSGLSLLIYYFYIMVCLILLICFFIKIIKDCGQHVTNNKCKFKELLTRCQKFWFSVKSFEFVPLQVVPLILVSLCIIGLSLYLLMQLF